MMASRLRFSCVQACNHCCIWRGYTDSHKTIIERDGVKRSGEVFLGKEGIELMPKEAKNVDRLVKKLERKYDHRYDDDDREIKYTVLPHTAILPEDRKTPPEQHEIETFQLMGRTEEGDICPFLSTQKENVRNAIGGLACLIYDDRFLWCRAFPLRTIKIDRELNKYASVDTGCQWVVDQWTSGYKFVANDFRLGDVARLNYSAMIRLQRGKYSNLENKSLWRYATGIYNKADAREQFVGWVNWGWD